MTRSSQGSCRRDFRRTVSLLEGEHLRRSVLDLTLMSPLTVVILFTLFEYSHLLVVYGSSLFLPVTQVGSIIVTVRDLKFPCSVEECPVFIFRVVDYPT